MGGRGPEQPVARLLGLPLAELAADGAFGAAPPAVEHDGEATWSVSDRALGLEVASDDGVRIAAVFLHAEGHQGFAAFADPLPGGLAFAMNRAEVRARLGSPIASGEASTLPFLGDYGPWDAFRSEGARLHVQFRRARDEIEMVTLQPADPA